jgi:hypothetical protein
MIGWRGGLAAVVCAAALGACAPLAPAPGAATNAGGSAVTVRQNLSGRYIALIGPKAQHDPPYLGAPGTNFFCLRSFVDRQTGATSHQLYVAASYDALRDWNAAHDSAGRALEFVPISRYKITCDRSEACSYAEEFAAILPENELSGNTGGFSVTFTDRADNAQRIAVSGGQVEAQLAALSAQQKNRAAAAAASAR